MSLFGPKRRRSRSSGSKGVDTVLTIAAIGALGVGAYFVLKSGKGFEEALGTAGGFLKNATDAINSTGEAIGSGSYNLQKALGIGSGAGSGSKGGIDNVDADESKDIIGKLGDAVGKSGYYKGIEREIEKNEDRSWIKRKDILGFGCGWLRQC
ncbi:MAG TPA: hypothetical protein VKA95_11345 [Nitrososphaeraceae archaeon]|nr:hypothetical protein [Nitrososphaeraceae archaeon]